MTQPDRTARREFSGEQLSEHELDQVAGGGIGSQSSGGGAGKLTFNPFSTTRLNDLASPNIFLKIVVDPMQPHHVG